MIDSHLATERSRIVDHARALMRAQGISWTEALRVALAPPVDPLTRWRVTLENERGATLVEFVGGNLDERGAWSVARQRAGQEWCPILAARVPMAGCA